ncbi:MAG: NAD(P)H-hydrate dehydratase [Solirubrobacterales bacterium]
MKIATAEIMRKIDNYSIDTLGIPGIVLMENAALKVVNNVKDYQSNICIVCSHGNNGGDGFAAARHLFVKGLNVEVFLIGTLEGMSSDCKTNYDAAKNIGINMIYINSEDELGILKKSVLRSDLVIDAIFGTGLTREVQGIYSDVIDIINEYKLFTLSIDVPSGMDSDTGKVMGNCIRADETVTFQLYKEGFLNYCANEYTGNIIIEEIGIPAQSIDKFHQGTYLVDKQHAKETLHRRNIMGHKGEYGRVLVIAGSEGFSGAAFISTQSAVRSGAGLVTLCCPREIRKIMCAKLAEAMTCSFDEEERLEELILSADSIAIGPGMGNNSNTLEILKKVVSIAKCAVVIDADGINVLKDNMHILDKRSCPIILTPHPGEFSRISGYSMEQIAENRMGTAKEFAEKHNVILLLKGYNTVITDGKEIYVNSSGNSAMASGGMGDCLTGIIGSLIGQGYDPITGAFMGAYVHGYAGERLSEELFSVNAGHIIDFVSCAMMELLKN